MPIYKDERKNSLYERAMHNLSYHRPKEQITQDAMEEIRQAAKDYTETVISIVPIGRELSMSITDIETSCIQAIAGLARHESAFVNGDG